MNKTQNLWHTLTKEDLFGLFGTGEKGLSNKEGEKRLLEYGENILEPKVKSNWGRILRSQFQSPLIYILIISALITSILGHPLDTSVILMVIIFNGIIGFIQEYKAQRAIRSLKKLFVSHSTVIRGGKKERIKNNLLVPGDIILLEIGVRAPADLRLLSSQDMEVDQSIVTGESLPARKNGNRLNTQKPLAERSNLIYSGSIITSGSGLALVTSTAQETILGEISQHLREAQENPTPLQIKMAEFGRFLLTATVLTCIGILIIGIVRGMDILEIFLTAVSLSVAAIPEGLPAITTITLAVGMHYLGQKGALTRRLVAVETLGSATLIATDKTGTLTENKMFLEKIYAGGCFYRLSGEGYNPRGNFYLGNRKINPHHNSKLTALLQASVLCNNGSLISEKNAKEVTEWKIIGDPTEGALLSAGLKAEIKKEEFDKFLPRIDAMPFSSRHSLMATLHQGKRHNLIAAKGSPESIIPLCRISNLRKREIKKNLQKMAMDGLRVLAIARKKTNLKKFSVSNREKSLSGMEFLGLTGIWDPPRPESKEAVQTAKKAGIRTIMITGDYQLTAFKIGQKVGIVPQKEIYLEGKNVITGENLFNLEKSELDRIIDKINIFARISPEHKFRLIQIFQKRGYVVGVTGDGVNDASALKVANIGIAMGKEGTDIAREASDIVLTDDNFATIIDIVRRGRNILQNIRRATFYLLSTNMAEVLIIALALLFSWPIPFLPSQILLINLITDGTAGAALAIEPDHENQLKYPPRDQREGIIDNLMLSRIITVGILTAVITLIIYKHYLGAKLIEAQTMAFVTLACAQVANLFNSRSFIKSVFEISLFSNKFIPLSALISLLGTILVVQIPFLGNLFHFYPLSLWQWLTAILLSSLLILTVEIEKWWRKL